MPRKAVGCASFGGSTRLVTQSQVWRFVSLYTIDNTNDFILESSPSRRCSWLTAFVRIYGKWIHNIVNAKTHVLLKTVCKHVCSGETFARQNMFLLLSSMMQNFTLELPEGQPMPDEKNHLPGSIVSPKYFQVHMTAR
ncbi:hypothetical protein J6590_088060 [Homalodisca vitripennis]|nr:hypothetical protein J6590_088060 [Homalodisca vitripennis]